MSQSSRLHPTLQQIADRAGVSRAVASVVLNEARSSVRVSDATRRRIRGIASELNYQPNALAQGLSNRRINAIGVLCSGFEVMFVGNAYVSGILEGIVWTTWRCDYNIVLFTKSAQDIKKSTSFVRDRRTDGLLVIDPVRDSQAIAALATEGMPLVAIGTGAANIGVPAVDVDNAAGARMAAEHLLSLGHRRIGYVPTYLHQHAGVARYEAYRAALCGAGLDEPERYFLEAGDVYESTRRMLSLPEPPTALLACNDADAIQILQAARDMRVSVPNRLSIVGFDDMPAAHLLTPPLTTVRQPLSMIGDKAALKLLDIINGEPVPARTDLIAPELVVRGSTMAPYKRRASAR
jgi:LacI family transcriptional regulator